MASHRRPELSAGVRPIPVLDTDATTWPGAVVIGQVDENELFGTRLDVVHGEGFSHARLLVWDGTQPRGFVEVPVTDGAIDLQTLRTETAHLPQVQPRPADWPLPPISVVVCTRDRPNQLRDVLRSLADLDYPDFEVLVVDNNPGSGMTPPVVQSFSSMPIRLVEAHGRGLSIARNVGITHAATRIVAFTDDDVVADPGWLYNLAYGFARDERVACVCGMVPSAEVNTPAQSYFDRRVGWAHGCEPAVYDLALPPQDDRLFPMRVAQFGTGANFALKKDVLIGVGGFDEGLGIGSPAGGGEDIDLFVRILLAGHVLVREPSAVVWHRHRRTTPELEIQVTNYGIGLGAWISKLVIRPRTLFMVMRRLRPAIRHLRGLTVVDQEDPIGTDPALDALYRRELQGVLDGPLKLLRSRLEGRRATPLIGRSRLMAALDRRRGQMWGDPGMDIVAGRLCVLAFVLGLIGALGAIRTLNTSALVIAVGAFTLAGPGSLAMSWYTKLPLYVLVPLLPAVSVAICLLVVSGLLMFGFYMPVLTLLGMAAVTAAGGLSRYAFLLRRRGVRTS